MKTTINTWPAWAPSTVIGFDRFFQAIDEAKTQTLSNWPPYNIKKTSDNTFVLEFAVAGFTQDGIDVQTHENVLRITGSSTLDSLTKDGVDVTYLHKGIADRSFTKEFTLADTVVVTNAELENGMLSIYLENVIPESKKPVKIPIGKKEQFLTE